jgi:hypothetical protein
VGLYKDDVSMSEVNGIETFVKNVMNGEQMEAVVAHFKAFT